MTYSHNNIRIAVLIVAGGSGTRMGNAVPKQFMQLAGKPVIVRSVETFRKVLPEATIYVALGQGTEGLWEKNAKKYGLDGICRMCLGGETRFDTVKKSLDVMHPCDIVLIHDAVRPLVSDMVIGNVIEATLESGAAVPVIPIVDSLRITDADGFSRPFDRNRLVAVQTPQAFKYDILSRAYGQHFREVFTDDSQVVEAAGHAVALCEGSRNNIKLTYPEDMVIARALLAEPGTDGNL